jgi:hypothetical protein
MENGSGERLTAAEKLAVKLSELQRSLTSARGSLARAQADVRSGYAWGKPNELEAYGCIRKVQAEISQLEPKYLELRNRERARRNTLAERDRARREQASQDVRDRQQMAWRALDSVVKAEEAQKQLAELKQRAAVAISQLPKPQQKEYRVRLSELG